MTRVKKKKKNKVRDSRNIQLLELKTRFTMVQDIKKGYALIELQKTTIVAHF